MREELKKFWNKYKKYIIVAFILMILGILLLNFIFVVTDYIAGKGFNGLAILYSPISNEEWLSFLGGFATFLLFLSAKETLENEKDKVRCENEMRKKELELERNKVRYENELKKLEKEKSVVEEYLNALDINEVYNLMNLISESSFKESFLKDKELMKNVENNRIEIVRYTNLAKMKLNCNTDFNILIRRNLLENEENQEKENLKENKELQILKNSINKKLTYLYGIHTRILGGIFKKIVKAVNTNSLKERCKEINLRIEDDEIPRLFQKIYEEYEGNLSDKTKSSLKEDISKGEYQYPFYICLDLTVDELKEYFDKKEK